MNSRWRHRRTSCPTILGRSLALAVLFWGVALATLRAEGRVVIFTHYNLENYAVIERHQGTGTVRAGKPVAEVDALIGILQTIAPDVLGVAEMGAPDQFEDFRRRLAAVGLGYDDAEYVPGADPDRHLALLSRYPIVSRRSDSTVAVDLPTGRLPVRRGFLDVTVEFAPGRRVRFVGAHLKSKLPALEGEALIRRAEAQALRERVDAAEKAEPDCPLLVYGDLNDTPESPAVAEVAGSRGTPGALVDLRLADPQGDRWTYYRRFTDTYARIDYVFVNRALLPWVDRVGSGVVRCPEWNRASDHRPVVTRLVVGE